jgi:hypothetical protein
VLNNNSGVNVTIGMVCNGDRVAIVLPLVIDEPSFDPDFLAEDAVNSVEANVYPFLNAVMSSSAYISFAAGEPMINGLVPSRHSYVPATYPGAAAPECAPSQVCALIVFYEDGLDVVPGHRVGVGKNFIPGIPRTAITSDTLGSAYVTSLQAFADGLQSGFGSLLYPTAKWWRMLRAPKPRTPGTHVKRVIVDVARGRIKTQRRRLIPQ